MFIFSSIDSFRLPGHRPARFFGWDPRLTTAGRRLVAVGRRGDDGSDHPRPRPADIARGLMPDRGRG